jgi:hypothetical protein
MGAPKATKKVPVNTQFVLVYSTDPEGAPVASAIDSARGKFLVALAFALLILMILGFARFRWYLI